MSNETEMKILKAKLAAANRYLTDTLRAKGRITTNEIFNVYSEDMAEKGVLFDVQPARKVKFDDDFVMEFLKLDPIHAMLRGKNKHQYEEAVSD